MKLPKPTILSKLLAKTNTYQTARLKLTTISNCQTKTNNPVKMPG